MKINEIFDRDIEYLYNSAKELGGTIREIACDSGLFEAVDYVRIKIDPTISGDILTKENIEPVEDNGSYSLWTEDSYYLGNGANTGWLCHNYYGNELVKPDVFAVEQAMNTYYAECVIRREEDPYFRIEEIAFDDEDVYSNISRLIVQTLPANWLTAFLHGEMPVSYKILVYQIVFIKYHFPKIYETVWNACPPYLEMDMPFRETGNVTMGIAVSEEKCCAVFTDSDLTTKNVYNVFTAGQSVSEKVQFEGIGDLEDEDAVCTKLDLTVRTILDAFRVNRVSDIAKLNVCVLGNMPNPSNFKTICENVDFEQLHCKVMDNPLIPIMKYYERNPKTRLAPGENALVLYIDEFRAMVGIASERNGSYLGIHSFFDKTVVADFDKHLVDEMYEVVKPKIEHLNISVSEEDRVEFAKQVLRIKKQFRRNKKAQVVFNNGWLNCVENLSIRVLEKYFNDLLASCELLLKELIIDEDGNQKYWLPDIKKLFLAGPMTDYEILWDIIKQGNAFGGKKELILCGELENVVTVGLTL